MGFIERLRSNEKFPRFIQSLSNFPGFARRTQGQTPLSQKPETRKNAKEQEILLSLRH